MPQQDILGKHATTVRYENGETIVRYHQTDILKHNLERICLNTGGWFTATTKTRLNQASNQFGLGFRVYQKDHEWFVSYQGVTIPFGGYDLISFNRN